MDDFENSILAGYLYSFLNSCESAIKKNIETSLEQKIKEFAVSLFSDKDFSFMDTKVYEYLDNEIESREEMQYRTKTDEKMIEVILRLKNRLKNPLTDSKEFPLTKL